MGISGYGGSLCHKAREYYYELLCHHDAAVPEVIAHHVEGCPFCQQQIRRLRDMLLPAADPGHPPEGPGDEGTVEALGRQFELLGEDVRCSHVKTFLPDLLASSPRIRIPTPITVHVEHCPRCRQDLASIRRLGLTACQLSRLGRFYNRSALRHPSYDEHTYATAAALAVFSLDGTDPEGLEHVSRCPACRAWIHQQRANTMAGLQAGTAGSGVLLCPEVSAADLFDYVMPFGLDAGEVGRADGRRDAVVTHVRACRRCMEKVQSLHRTIYEIADRADSAVSTFYRCDDGAEDAGAEAQDAGYRYPIYVEVLKSAPAPAGAGFRRRFRPRVKAKPLFRRTALAAAAVVAVALLFLVNAPTATGMSVGDLTKAITANFHIATWYKNGPKPIQEMWVSRDLNRVVTKSPREYVEYDLNEGIGRVKRPDLGAALEVWRLAAAQIDVARSLMNRPLADIFSEERSEATLSEVNSMPSPDRPGVLLPVYELTREMRSSNGAPVSYRWRVSVDSQRRPVQIEISRLDSAGPMWESETVVRLTYPTTPEMENAFKALPAME